MSALDRLIVELSAALAAAAVVALGYLIGLTYVAKQENLGKVENLWPLVFLLAPLAYGLFHVFGTPWTAAFCLALATRL